MPVLYIVNTQTNILEYSFHVIILNSLRFEHESRYKNS